MNEEDLVKFVPEVRRVEGKILLDPQFYLPRATRERLREHAYWPDDYGTSTFYEGGHVTMVKDLVRLNDRLGVQEFIVPGTYASEVDEAWLDTQRLFHEAAAAATDVPLVRTVALSVSAVKQRDQTQEVAEFAEKYPVPTHYLVLERAELLTDDPVWLSNALDLVASLRRGGSKVILAYQNQQGLLAALAGADAIASGTFDNLRMFDQERFFQKEQGDTPGGPKPWYYLPQGLSEYRLNYLDIAYFNGHLQLMDPSPPTVWAQRLFEGAQPSAIGWKRPDAFRHYLSALRQQVRAATHRTFDSTVVHHLEQLATAEELVGRLKALGIRPERKDISGAIEAHRSAIINLEQTHGAALRRDWTTWSN